MSRPKRRSSVGQGLVEFALILPLLLMVLIGIFEFGRILLIYSNLFNAAREGVRYGITNPRDQGGIYDRAIEHTLLISEGDPDLSVEVTYDAGPGGAARDRDTVTVGDRVLVQVTYPIRPMTPFFDPLVGVINLNTQAARTVQSVGLLSSGLPPTGVAPPGVPTDPGDGDPSEPPSDPPSGPQIAIDPTCGPAGDQTITVSGTGWTSDNHVNIYFNNNRRIDKGGISGETFSFQISVQDVSDGSYPIRVDGHQSSTSRTVTFTVPCPGSPPDEPNPIVIARPVIAGQTQITGSAEPGEDVTLLVDNVVRGTATVSSAGLFSFIGLAPLEAGAQIVVQGYGEQDSTIVQEVDAPTEIVIDRPLRSGDTLVQGSAEPGATVSLRVNGNWRASATVDASGRFSFAGVSPPLLGGNVVIVEGYGAQDLVVVDRRPIGIAEPVYAGDTVVTGEAEPNHVLTLRIIQTGLRRTVAADADGAFRFADLPGLVEGHTAIVEGYGEQDSAIVQTNPAEAHIYIDETCLPVGSQSFSVHVNNPSFSNSTHKVTRVYWDGLLAATASKPSASFSVLVTRNVTLPGPHTLRVDIENNSNQVQVRTPTISVPVCDVETPDLPDLIITSLELMDVPPHTTYERINLSVAISNIGDAHVTSLFWVDLFADADPEMSLTEQTSVDYVAVNALAAGSTITFTMYVPYGFADIGEHTLTAMVDAWDQIEEINEDNNISATAIITVTEEGLPPDPPTVVEGPTGNIAGWVWIDDAEAAGVAVYLYAEDGRLVDSTRSISEGRFGFADVAYGIYTIVGEYREADAYALVVETVEIAAELTPVELRLVTMEAVAP